ncbi:MAG: Wzz/FepE/Etk N-terminal domain-containing protein [Candidatus Zixiibacteriota bacterium]
MTTEPSNSFWILLDVLARRRRLFMTIVLGATILATIIAFVLPKWYKAEALLLPPKDISAPISGLKELTDVASVTQGLDLPLLATPSDVYARILKSRTIADTIMTAFDLVRRYEAENADEAYKALMSNAEFKVTDEGLLLVTVEDKDPQIAAQIANRFIDELDKINSRITLARVSENRQFIEERLAKVKSELDSARKELQEFQQVHRTVDFDEQTRLAIDQAIALKSLLANIDLDLQVKERMLGQNNADLQELRRRRADVTRQLASLEQTNRDSSYFSLPISSIPRLKVQYEEIYSRVRVGEALYNVLLEEYEKARINENKSFSTISVLDRATPPELRSRPKRTIIVLSAFAVSVIVASLLASLLEFLRRMKESNSGDYERVARFISAYLGWLPGVKR